MNSSQQPAFSLIEVLFAVAFLIMVGLAMISLNSAALKLISNTEVKTVANDLNEESIAVVSLLKKTDTNFNATLSSLNCTTTGCYVNCSATQLDQACSLTATSSPVQLGRNKLQFVRKVIVKEVGTTGRYNIQATVSWGSGEARESTISQLIE